jgi:hypothetical protein
VADLNGKLFSRKRFHLPKRGPKARKIMINLAKYKAEVTQLNPTPKVKNRRVRIKS